ncbi:hypothetical protein SKAU_G00019650 [Synaphobranchus kaupii]|uniref:Uncharacterized protein n=1 Tax=Synaphobranchus kaupii TaxID=118154 RepID=A0A9Q1GBZ7_SYNKA|nr:hypothetical protein SKAU_G00019650 [Synaphobranchus kaupii]
MGTHRSPHMGVTTLPIMISRGMHLDAVGSTTMVLPGDIGTLLGSLPHTSGRSSSTATAADDRVAGPSASSDESSQPQPISEIGSREEEEEEEEDEDDDDNDISGPQQPTEPSDDNTSSTNQGLEAEPVRQKTIGIR